MGDNRSVAVSVGGASLGLHPLINYWRGLELYNILHRSLW